MQSAGCNGKSTNSSPTLHCGFVTSVLPQRVCIPIAVNFVQFENVLIVLFHERYLLLPCVFEKDVKESTESIHLCLLCNGMNCVQSNLYEENKAELSLGYHQVHFFLIDPACGDEWRFSAELCFQYITRKISAVGVFIILPYLNALRAS